MLLKTRTGIGCWQPWAIKRLHAEGVDVTQRDSDGVTSIMLAVYCNGHASTVKFLLTAGASTMDKDNSGYNTLLHTAIFGEVLLLQYFLQEAGASFIDTTNDDQTVWDLLEHKEIYGGWNQDPVALASLLKIMVMLDDAPPAFVAKLSSAYTKISTRGRLFRVHLPSYLEQQRASVFEHCPLPPVLLPIVAGYAPTTPEDMWTYGLRVQAS
jgi:hypothetical protein